VFLLVPCYVSLACDWSEQIVVDTTVFPEGTSGASMNALARYVFLSRLSGLLFPAP
jgi:hypothetical protein